MTEEETEAEEAAFEAGWNAAMGWLDGAIIEVVQGLGESSAMAVEDAIMRWRRGSG